MFHVEHIQERRIAYQVVVEFSPVGFSRACAGASRKSENTSLREGPTLGRIVAIVNQKGGVGKTTTAVNLSAAVAIAERSTLLIDLDPQSNSTRALGVPADPARTSVYDLLTGDAAPAEGRLKVEGIPYLSLLPADPDLIGAEIELVDQSNREFRLRSAIQPLRSEFEFIFVDCPPSLGLLTLNALSAADSVLIPVQCEYLALEGISQLTDTLGRIREALNPALAIEGIVMTMYDDRTNLSKQVVEEVRSVFGDQVFDTVIPRNVRLGEAPSHGKPVFLYDIRSKGADAYFSLAKEFLEHEAKSVGQGASQPDPGSAPPHAA
jgi:chromosome partitioning protein